MLVGGREMDGNEGRVRGIREGGRERLGKEGMV